MNGKLEIKTVDCQYTSISTYNYAFPYKFAIYTYKISYIYLWTINWKSQEYVLFYHFRQTIPHFRKSIYFQTIASRKC